MYEIEGIVLTSGWSNRNPAQDMAKALGAINAYELDLPNLMKRSSQIGFAHDNERQEIGYLPSAQYLRDRTMFGSLSRGMTFIGANNNSDGSEEQLRSPSPLCPAIRCPQNSTSKSAQKTEIRP